MNLSKHLEILDPINDINATISIIGCGAIGSTIAVMLTRLGIPAMELYDFDTVTEHNITNQQYRLKDVGSEKTKALKEILKEINPEVEIKIHNKYTNAPVSGYIFLAVDDIEIRKQCVIANKMNPYCKGILDFRLGLYNAQHYAAKNDKLDSLLKTMDFTHDEAKANVPVSPCGTTLGVMPTVQAIVAAGVINFIKMIKTPEYTTMLILDLYQSNIITI